jgi:hypothetical protein
MYEDAHILSLFVDRGQDGPLLVTFSDLAYKPTPGRFSADVVAEKLGLSALGIVAKTPNWYPTENVLAAAEASAHVLSKFEQKVTYGGSMGGYAAIKFSDAYSANRILSMCPQATINPIHCGSIDDRFKGYWAEGSGGDLIKSSEISGQLFLFFDPFHKIDSWHAEQIVKLSPTAAQIKVPFSGHHTSSILAGATRLKALLKNSAELKFETIRRDVASIRRQHDLRARVLLETASKKHPLLCDQVLRNILLRKEDLQYPQRFWEWAEAMFQ